MPRNQDRITYHTEVSLHFASGRRQARMSDLSQGGCYVECIATVRPGEVVHFEIPMPDGKIAKASGEVKYVFNGMGFGMSFLDMPEDLRALIDWLVQSQPVAAN